MVDVDAMTSEFCVHIKDTIRRNKVEFYPFNNESTGNCYNAVSYEILGSIGYFNNIFSSLSLISTNRKNFINKACIDSQDLSAFSAQLAGMQYLTFSTFSFNKEADLEIFFTDVVGLQKNSKKFRNLMGIFKTKLRKKFHGEFIDDKFIDADFTDADFINDDFTDDENENESVVVVDKKIDKVSANQLYTTSTDNALSDLKKKKTSNEFSTSEFSFDRNEYLTFYKKLRYIFKIGLKDAFVEYNKILFSKGLKKKNQQFISIQRAHDTVNYNFNSIVDDILCFKLDFNISDHILDDDIQSLIHKSENSIKLVTNLHNLIVSKDQTYICKGINLLKNLTSDTNNNFMKTILFILEGKPTTKMELDLYVNYDTTTFIGKLLKNTKIKPIIKNNSGDFYKNVIISNIFDDMDMTSDKSHYSTFYQFYHSFFDFLNNTQETFIKIISKHAYITFKNSILLLNSINNISSITTLLENKGTLNHNFKHKITMNLNLIDYYGLLIKCIKKSSLNILHKKETADRSKQLLDRISCNTKDLDYNQHDPFFFIKVLQDTSTINNYSNDNYTTLSTLLYNNVSNFRQLFTVLNYDSTNSTLPQLIFLIKCVSNLILKKSKINNLINNNNNRAKLTIKHSKTKDYKKKKYYYIERLTSHETIENKMIACQDPLIKLKYKNTAISEKNKALLRQANILSNNILKLKQFIRIITSWVFVIYRSNVRYVKLAIKYIKAINTKNIYLPKIRITDKGLTARTLDKFIKSFSSRVSIRYTKEDFNRHLKFLSSNEQTKFLINAEGSDDLSQQNSITQNSTTQTEVFEVNNNKPFNEGYDYNFVHTINTQKVPTKSVISGVVAKALSGESNENEYTKFDIHVLSNLNNETIKLMYSLNRIYYGVFCKTWTFLGIKSYFSINNALDGIGRLTPTESTISKSVIYRTIREFYSYYNRSGRVSLRRFFYKIPRNIVLNIDNIYGDKKRKGKNFSKSIETFKPKRLNIFALPAMNLKLNSNITNIKSITLNLQRSHRN